MGIAKLDEEGRKVAQEIVEYLRQNPVSEVLYDKQGKLVGDLSKYYEHVGLYSFILTQDNKKGIVYVGKSEETKYPDRVRQHLTGENKDGSVLADTVATKHKKIRQAVKQGYKVELALFANEKFTNSSLAFVESYCIKVAQSILISGGSSLVSWNKRVG
jgi:hypothetical protein